MPLALSGGPYVYSRFSGGSRLAIYNGVLAGLVAAGWLDVGASATATGRRLQGSSPQGLTVNLDLYDPGSGTQIGVQFDYPTGFVHLLGTYTGETYQIVAGPCQFFISLIGINGSDNAQARGSTVCGGIPFLPTPSGGTDVDCGNTGVNGDATTESWWATGDGINNALFTADTMRNTIEGQNSPGGVSASEGKFNGSYCAGGGVGASRLIALTFSDFPSVPGRYPDGSPLIVEPLIGWGDTQTTKMIARGQIWDAMLVCEAHPMDDTARVFGSQELDAAFTWINYIDNVTEGALYLISGQPSASNDSYVY